MKSAKLTYLFWILSMGLVVTSASCGGDDSPEEEPTAQEIAFELLAGAWQMDSQGITVDGSDVSANYPGFSLSFTDGGYTTSNAGDLFEAAGTWEWMADSDRMIRLDDGKQINISTLTTTEFVFSFQFDGTGGVAAGIAGSYVIRMMK